MRFGEGMMSRVDDVLFRPFGREQATGCNDWRIWHGCSTEDYFPRTIWHATRRITDAASLRKRSKDDDTNNGASGLTTRNKKLVETSASLVVTSALLVVTRS